jgi:purine-binding chemotaxis protein CheW
LDIVIFELAERQWGIELALVREVVSLGPITPVPVAPAELAGAVNHRGHVTAVLDLELHLTGLLERLRPTSRQAHDSGLLVEVAGHRLVICVGRVREVARLQRPVVLSTGALRGALSNVVADALLGVVHVVDLEAVLSSLRQRMKLAATYGEAAA